MKNAHKEKCVTLPIAQAACEIPIDLQIFLDCAAESNIQLVFHTPASTAIYLTESQFDDKYSPYSMQKSSRPLLARNIEYLYLEANDYKNILQTGGIIKSTFSGYAKFEKPSRELVQSTPDDYHFINVIWQRVIDFPKISKYSSNYREQYDSFTSCHPQPNSHQLPENILEIEKKIHIKLEDLMITRKDLNLIRGKLGTPKTDYGKFIVREWTSSNLAILNEASTYFFSLPETHLNRPSAEKINEIKSWLRAKWHGHPGESLLEQAANIIIPDKFYAYSPSNEAISKETRNENNEYASTALIIINDTAKRYHKEKLENKHTDNWGKKIIKYLNEEHGLGVRISRSASTIIIQKD